MLGQQPCNDGVHCVQARTLHYDVNKHAFHQLSPEKIHEYVFNKNLVLSQLGPEQEQFTFFRGKRQNDSRTAFCFNNTAEYNAMEWGYLIHGVRI